MQVPKCIRKAHGFSDARIRKNLNRTIVYFLCRLFGRKSNKKSKCDRRSTLKDDSHFTHSKGPHVSAHRQNFVLVLTLSNFLTVGIACENSRPSSLPVRVAFQGPRAKKDGCFRRLLWEVRWPND